MLARCHRQIRIRKRRVGKSEPERKEYRLLLRVVPLVSHFQLFVVVGLERRQTLEYSPPMIRSWRRISSRWWLHNSLVRQVCLASGKRDRQLATRIHIA